MSKPPRNSQQVNSLLEKTSFHRKLTPRYQPLVIVLIAMTLGIVCDRAWELPMAACWMLSLATIILWMVAFLIRRDKAAAWILLLSVAFAGAAWHHSQWYCFESDSLARSADHVSQPVCVQAVAMSGSRVFPAPQPDRMRTIPQGPRTEVVVNVTHVRHREDWQEAGGESTLWINGELEGINAGDRLEIHGQFNIPQPALNPREFDFAEFNRADRQFVSLRSNYPECVKVIRQGSSWSIRHLIENLRSQCNSLLWKHLDEKRYGLATAILLGSREQISDESEESFFHTGTVHLLAVSGLHVGILASLFYFLAHSGFFPRRLSLICIILLVILYALLTHSRAPVIRASILVTVACTGAITYRRPLALNTLAAAAIVLLFLNPTELFQTGAQLSFLAVMTLSIVGSMLLNRPRPDPLKKLIDDSRPRPLRVLKKIRNRFLVIFLLGASIWFVALPLVMYQFHLVSPIGLLLNPIAWIPVAFSLIFGFATIVFGWFIPPLGAFFGWVCDLNLAMLQAAVNWASSIPGSYFWTPGPAGWWVGVFYLGLITPTLFPKLRPPRRWIVALISAWMAVGFSASLATSYNLSVFSTENPPLDCTFLSVGSGTSVVVEFPQGQKLLYDAGRLGSPTSGLRSISSFLWSRGVTHLDAVVISHADADHYNALPELLERFSVGVVYVSPVMFFQETPALEELRRSIKSSGVPLRELHAGNRVNIDDTTLIDVLHPSQHGLLGIGNDNANSIVLAIEHEGRRILLPGDLESPGLEEVIAELPLHCDVVMAPHHGSANSNPEGFAEWCTPDWLVISSGLSRDSSSVEAAYQNIGSKVLHTAKHGAVRVRLSAEGIKVQHWQNKRWN